MMNTNSITTNFIWRLAERWGNQIVSFVVALILARLLGPEAYGTVALVTVFTTIMNVFIDSGFGNALIQKKNADDLDFSSVFVFNVVISIVLYLIMFFCAPLIANYYRNPVLVSVIRVLSIMLLISGIKNVQFAYVSRNMMFRKFFFSTLGGTIGAAIIGIGMALLGMGVWALVSQYVFNAFVDMIILWLTVKWKPQMRFSMDRIKKLFSYGWKLLATNLVETIYNNLVQLIIGKKYTSSDLAYYNRGKRLPDLIIININTSLDSVLFAALSKVQDNKSKVNELMRKSIKLSMFIISPCLFGMAGAANSIVRVLLGEGWIDSVPFMQICCIILIFYPIQTSIVSVLKSTGRSDIVLKLEIIRKIIGIICVLITFNKGVFTLLCGLLLAQVIASILNAVFAKKLIGYEFKKQIFDILPILLISSVMYIVVMFLGYVKLSVIVVLFIQIISGILVYVSLAVLFRFEQNSYCIEYIKELMNKKKG